MTTDIRRPTNDAKFPSDTNDNDMSSADTVRAEEMKNDGSQVSE